MEIALIIILLLAVLLSHNKLNGKIRKLENEIIELNNKLLHQNQELPEKKTGAATTSLSSHPDSKHQLRKPFRTKGKREFATKRLAEPYI